MGNDGPLDLPDCNVYGSDMIEKAFQRGRDSRAVIVQHLKNLCTLAEERQLDFGNDRVAKMFDDAKKALKEDAKNGCK